MNYRYHHRPVLLMLLLILAQGCGQKGPLYIPDEQEREENRLIFGN